MKMYLKLIVIAAALMALYGCGGGSSSGESQVSDSYVFPAGKATLTFSAMSTAQLPTSISGIDFSLVLPTGMDVTTVNGVGVSGGIDSTTLTGASFVYNVYGNYDSSNRTTTLGMVTTSNTFRSGEFMRLTCTVASNTSISLADLKAANNPVSLIKVVGIDSSNTTIQLTDKVKVTIGAVK